MAKPNRYIFGTKAKRSPAMRAAFLFCIGLLCTTLLLPLLKDRFSFESRDRGGQESPVAPTENREPCAPEDVGPVIDISKGVVQPGDTMSNILGQYFGPSDIHTLVQKCADVFPLSRINAGREYSIISEDNTFRSFIYDIDSEEQLIIEHAEDGFVVNRVPIEYETETATVRGSITDSLFQAVDDCGEGASLVFAIAGIYEWDIDFTRDLRQGDSFNLVVEKRYREGAFAGYGKVLAARFDNQGTPFYAVLFEESEGRPSYFNLEGRSMRKAFLKAPLKFTRISSGYNLRRMHPILSEVRAHPAIDYAAPTGTPVRTVGDGTVTYAGYNGAAGNMIKVQHRNGYETWYLHLQGYARGVRKGTRVSQGQVIGYVGSTGRSTGPHLDFRMRLNGKYVNPMSVKMPPAENVSKARLDAFERAVRHLKPLLDAEEPFRVQTPTQHPPAKAPTAL